MSELPADIEAAIDAFDSAAQARGWEACMRSVAAADAAELEHAERRAILAAAILARLAAAEAARDEAQAEVPRLLDDLYRVRAAAGRADVALGELEAERDAAIARAERLEAALAGILPGKLCGESWDLPDTERMPIQTTLGALKEARAALADPAPAEEARP